MGIERYFLHDFFTAYELNHLEEQLADERHRHVQKRAEARQRVVSLEDGLARVALLARSLAELCIAKGVLTREELTAQLAATDFADGARDQRLDPEVALPGEEKLADLSPIVPPPKPRGKQGRRR
jgi:hypothetical protein